MRWYEIDSDVYPSITTILGHTLEPEKRQAIDNWRASLGATKADAYTKRAADRGTILHSLIEKHLKGEVAVGCGETTVEINMFKSMLPMLKQLTPVGQEVVLYSHGLEVAGRCDFIGYHKDELKIVDFKSSTNPKTDKKIEDYKLQLAFYALSHNEMFGTDISKGVVMMGVENGLPLKFEIKLDDYIEALYHRVQNFYINLKV